MYRIMTSIPSLKIMGMIAFVLSIIAVTNYWFSECQLIRVHHTIRHDPPAMAFDALMDGSDIFVHA